jgi:hypothetical protein
MHDGRVPVCCHDWKQDLVLGQISEKVTLTDIWFGDKHRWVLRNLYKKDRSFAAPCNRCDYWGGARQGITPDPDAPKPDVAGLSYVTLTGRTSETGRERRGKKEA